MKLLYFIFIMLLFFSHSSCTAQTSATNSNSNDTDCKSCTYFPLCKYDYVRTFQGEVYKGVNYDNGIFYYNCNNGILIQKRQDPNDATKFYSHIILKYNEPAGTKWSDVDVAGNTTTFTIVSKNKTLNVNGTMYKDVIVVYDKQFTTNSYGNQSVSESLNRYFAKDFGVIKTENVDNSYDVNKAMQDIKTSDSVRAVLPVVLTRQF